MSRLRARCPDCRANTAVALDDGEYQCHACGREFAAGLVRVARAWGDGGRAMEEASLLEVPWPEAAVIDEDTLESQIARQMRELPDRPLVLGGCCCAHVGAVRELARRHGRIGIVWIDAHGDLNTPETSPSGNAWGMPLRMILEAGAVAARDVVLLGARSLDVPEVDYIRERAIRQELGGGLPELVYVAVDADAVEPAEIDAFMPEPGGLRLEEIERTLASLPRPVGAGFTGFVPTARNADIVGRLGHALGL